MKRDDPIWRQLGIVLGKWAREEPLTDDDQRTLVKAQNLDIERYKAMRQEVQSKTPRDHDCW